MSFIYACPEPSFLLDLSKLTEDKIHSEMARVEEAFQRIIGVTPAFVRPPYGK
jgi:hypothetical protein